jgi:hypothetical protein
VIGVLEKGREMHPSSGSSPCRGADLGEGSCARWEIWKLKQEASATLYGPPTLGRLNALGCGTGRLSLMLWKGGVDLEVDSSASLSSGLWFVYLEI